MALNRRDLESFFKGDVQINALVAGINRDLSANDNSKLDRMPRGGSTSNYVSERMSVASNKDVATMVADKQRRLLQLGYSKDILKNNPGLIADGIERNNTISHNEDYIAGQKNGRL